MTVSFHPIETNLKSNIDDIHWLAKFDHVILDIAISQLKELEKRLQNDHLIDNPRLTAAAPEGVWKTYVKTTH